MKFILRFTGHNIIRHPGKSILSAMISAILLIFLFVLFSNINASQQQLDDLDKTISVTAQITNEQGSQMVGLRISDRQMLQTEALPGVEPVSSTADIEVMWGHNKKETIAGPDAALAGANNLDASPIGGQDKRKITWLAGWSESEFFSTQKAACIVPEQFLEQHDLKVGELFSVTLYEPTYPTFSAHVPKLLGNAKFEVAGSYPDLPGDQKGHYIVSSLNSLRAICNGLGKEFYRDSTSVQLNTALSLNQFKESLLKLGLKPVDTTKELSRDGNSVIVYDRNFKQAAAPLQSNIHSLQRLESLFLFLVILIGGLASFLLSQSRRAEIALHRSMGFRKRDAFLLMFVENAILCLFGCLLGVIGMLLTMHLPIALAGETPGIFFVCYMLGATTALLLINRVSVLKILHSME